MLESSESVSENLSVAVCQMTSTDDVSANCEQILDLLAQLEKSVPDLICFPENALFLRLQEGTDIRPIPLDAPEIKRISKWSQEHGAVVHIGSIPAEKAGRLYNTSLVLTPDGFVHDNYRKIHLFDVDVEGHRPMRESDVFAHGEEPATFWVKGWKVGSTICYDLRFSELFHRYARMDVDVILIPSAFLVPTGRAHWSVLTRARAIETQAYVLAAAQGGEHKGTAGGTRSTYGHSSIIDPWGVVIAECPEEFGDSRILKATLSKERVRSVRAQIPMKGHRRLT